MRWIRCELRRRGQPETPPDSMSPREEESAEDEPAGGANEQHPVHDNDQGDMEPEGHVRKIDRLDEAAHACSP